MSEVVVSPEFKEAALEYRNAVRPGSKAELYFHRPIKLIDGEHKSAIVFNWIDESGSQMFGYRTAWGISEEEAARQLRETVREFEQTQSMKLDAL